MRQLKYLEAMCGLLEDMRVLEVPEVLYLNQAADNHCFLLVKTGIFNFFSSSSGTSRQGESPQYYFTTLPYFSLLLSADDTPCPSDSHLFHVCPRGLVSFRVEE